MDFAHLPPEQKAAGSNPAGGTTRNTLRPASEGVSFARIAVATVRSSRTPVAEVRFVLFDDAAHRAFESALG
ncbi:hypothetical protein MFAL_39720 [Mycolicibacterium fallax]|nr:hypothetical protein MFAL_39720 [Mycolicibacterium fallax]